MLSKRKGRTFLKFCIIWTLMAAVFTAAYSTGLYLLYENGISCLEEEIVIVSNAWYHQYHSNNDRLMLRFPADSNYCYFGKIEDDGSLTDIYTTDYSSFRVYSSDVMFPDSDYNNGKLVEYYLTTDADKQGKIVSTSYEISTFDPPSFQSCEQHYLSCPDGVLDKIKNSQEKGTSRAKKYIPYDGHGTEWMFYKLKDSDFSYIIHRAFGEVAAFLSDRLLHIFDEITADDYIVEDTSDGVSICRADVDLDAGKIFSGELKINGEKTAFPDNSLTDSNTTIYVHLHKRPDSILENNKELLRDNFDESYLKDLNYQYVEDADELYSGTLASKSGLRSYTYDYKYEDGQAVVSGISKYEDGYYRYVYIIPLAGFWEAFTPWIAEPLVLVWLPGLIIGGLFSLVISKKRYV